MKKIKGFKNIIMIILVIISLENCINKNDVPSLKTQKKSYELVENKYNKIQLPAFSDIRNVSLFSIHRNLPTKADLNANNSISIKVNSALLTAYNLQNSTSFELLPDSLFTLGSQITKTGADYTLNFSQQESIQSFDIKLNGQKINLTKQYALPFVLTTTGNINFYTYPLDIIKNSETVIALISLKNKYDNTYVSNGYVYHPTTPRTIVNRTKIVSTIGPTSVSVELGDMTSFFVAYIAIDTSTNNLTISIPPDRTGTYMMFTGGLPTTNPGYTSAWANSSKCNNTYDPVTRSFNIRYGYLGSGGWRVFEEIIKRN